MYSAVKWLLLLGLRFWVALLGERRAKRFLIAGLVCSTITALILEETL